jgi:hypothetical protein
MVLSTIPVIILINSMEYEFAVFVGSTESHSVKVFERYFSFYGVL